ncbi:MFS transporter [Actinoallomurus rhizosphaericola]|uniref:MFS transporter n=1 Tax=Actinoallomurus rhizosphaericola TaxID=2952536 RepID=UPI002092134A|nr:MFS transporter [Actinoallomurus rhizosphaericola]MCO5996427.1 MFS transporter [Actinoallomurus rhizosphaericola]
MDPQTIQRRRWSILGVLIVSLLVIVLDNTILNVALKTIADPRDGLGATQGQLEWAINSYTLVFAGLLFTFGVLGDRIGRKRMLMIGMTLFGLASLLSSLAQTPDQLILARAAMGFGGAAVMPQTLSIITNVFEPHERARAIGLWAGAVGIGVAIGPITGGLLLDHFWWGSVFLINVPVVIAGVIGIALLVPESRNPIRAKIDFGGVLLSIAGLILLTYGIIEGGDKATVTAPTVYGSVLAGVVLLAVFVWYESRIEHPSLNVRLFRDGRLSASVGAIALVFFALGGVFLFISLYLQDVRGYTPLQAGLLTLPLAAGQMIFSPRSAGLVARFGARPVAATGLTMVALALLSYHFAAVHNPIWTLEITFFVQGAGMALVMTPATTAVMSVLPREQAGSGSAINNIARQVSVALGTALLGSLVASIYRSGMKPHLTGLPQGLRSVAGSDIGATTGVAEKLGTAGRALLPPAHDSFVHAMHITSAVSAAVAFLGALVVLKWMPGRPAAAPDIPQVEQREAVEV